MNAQTAPASPMVDEILRIPPHSAEAEAAVIGATLLRGSMCGDTLALSPSDFYHIVNADLWAFMQGCVERDGTVDVLILRDAIRSAPSYREVKADELLAALQTAVDSSVSANNAGRYARIVAEKAALRRILYATEAIRKAAYDGEEADDLLGRVRALVDREAAARATSSKDSFPWETDTTMESSKTTLEWVLRGFLAKGAVSLLVGQPKAGKSWWVYALLAAMERGDEEFVGYPLHGRRAVVLSEEAPGTILGKRRRFGGSDAGAAFLTRTAAFPPRPLRVVIDEAMRKAREIGAETIVVDTWAIWAHLPPDAEKDAGATQKALEPLLAAAGQGFAVLVVHHMKKADGEDGTSVRGSSALLGTIDILIELRRFGEGDEGGGDGKSGKRALKTMGRFEECPEEVIVELQGDRFINRGTAKSARVASLSDKVVDAITNAPAPVSFSEVAGLVGVSTSGGRAKAGLHAALRLATDEKRIQTWAGDGSKWNPTKYAPPGVERPVTPPAKGS